MLLCTVFQRIKNYMWTVSGIIYGILEFIVISPSISATTTAAGEGRVHYEREERNAWNRNLGKLIMSCSQVFALIFVIVLEIKLFYRI